MLRDLRCARRLEGPLFQIEDDWAHPAGYAQALLQLAVATLIAIGVLRRTRWGFWLAGACGLFCLGARLIAAIVLLRLADPVMRGPLDPRAVTLLIVELVLLGAAVGLLLLPPSRSVLAASSG